MAVTYDSVNILSGDFNLRRTTHDNSVDTTHQTLVPTRQDGEVIISSNFGTKYIDLYGHIVGDSQSDLEINIDEFKGTVSRRGKNLDISYAGGTRRYVCQPISCTIDRDFYHLTYAPFHVRFLVPLGYGTDTSATTFIDLENITDSSDSVSTVITLATYPPKGIHKVTLQTVGNADFIQLENVTSGDYIEVDLEDFADTDYLEIDDENFTVKKNGTTDLEWRGKIPSIPLEYSSNNIRLQFQLRIYGNGSTLDQQNTDNDDEGRMYDDGGIVDALGAQSFICGRSGHVEKLTLFIGKTGTPTGSMAWYIAEDDNNKPGAQITSTEFEIATAAVPSTAAFKDVDLNAATAPYLHKDRKYWIVYTNSFAGSTDAANYFEWGYSEDPTSYVDGKAMARQSGNPLYNTWKDGIGDSREADGVIDGQYDYDFKVYMGDNSAPSWDIDWTLIATKSYI